MSWIFAMLLVNTCSQMVVTATKFCGILWSKSVNWHLPVAVEGTKGLREPSIAILQVHKVHSEHAKQSSWGI